MSTDTTLTLAAVKAAVHAFESSPLPKMSLAWDELRRAAQEAAYQYASQENMTIDVVIALVKGEEA